MCGIFVTIAHLFIAPTIILSAYNGWVVPLYILGFGALAYHGIQLVLYLCKKHKLAMMWRPRNLFAPSCNSCPFATSDDN